MSKKNRGSILLLVAALLWGTTFAFQKLGMESMKPLAFNGTRMILGGFICIFMFYVSRTFIAATKNEKASYGSFFTPTLLKAGVLCGLCLCLASNFQQVGIVSTTPAKAGFITTLYIVIVPILGVFRKKLPKPIIWFCVVLAVTGFYFMCITDGLSLGGGDLLVLVCAFLYSLHIITVDEFAPNVNGILLSSCQFFVCGVLSIIASVIFEPGAMNPSAIQGALPSILYAGIMSCGIAYTFQILGQKDVPPSLASLLMSFESVFSILGGILVFGEFPTPREGFGCLLVFIAVILAQRVS